MLLPATHSFCFLHLPCLRYYHHVHVAIQGSPFFSLPSPSSLFSNFNILLSQVATTAYGSIFSCSCSSSSFILHGKHVKLLAVSLSSLLSFCCFSFILLPFPFSYLYYHLLLPITGKCWLIWVEEGCRVEANDYSLKGYIMQCTCN